MREFLGRANSLTGWLAKISSDLEFAVGCEMAVEWENPGLAAGCAVAVDLTQRAQPP